MDCAGLIDAYLIGMSEGPSFDAAMERRFQDYLKDPGARLWATMRVGVGCATT